jgi:hypothetical protein
MGALPTKSQMVDGLKAEACRIEQQIEELNDQLKAIKQVVARLDGPKDLADIPPPGTEVAREASTFQQLGLPKSYTAIRFGSGVTDAIRKAIREAGTPLTPPEIRDRVASLGFSCEEHPNLIQVIHSTIKRLPEVKRVASSGKVKYVWKPQATS